MAQQGHRDPRVTSAPQDNRALLAKPATPGLPEPTASPGLRVRSAAPAQADPPDRPDLRVNPETLVATELWVSPEFQGHRERSGTPGRLALPGEREH